MKTASPLYAGIRLARKGKYAKALEVLLPRIYNYRDSWLFYYTLALACLRSGDTGAARDYIKSAYDIKQNEPAVLLALAALHVKRGDSARAVRYYLQTLERDPANKRARRGLRVLRKHASPERLARWAESGRVASLYPPFPPVPGARARMVLLPLGAAALVLAGLGAAREAHKRANAPARSGFAESALEEADRGALTGVEGAFRYVLTEREMNACYEKARRLFNEGRDDAARVELNRVLLANSSDGLKNKARLLAGYLESPGFDTIRERFSYAEVAREPELYEGCAVRWRGMAANIEAGRAETAFDLLAGYDRTERMEGRVRVVFRRAVGVDAGRPLEVLGIVHPAKPAAEFAAFFLEGRALQQPSF